MARLMSLSESGALSSWQIPIFALSRIANQIVKEQTVWKTYDRVIMFLLKSQQKNEWKRAKEIGFFMGSRLGIRYGAVPSQGKTRIPGIAEQLRV